MVAVFSLEKNFLLKLKTSYLRKKNFFIKIEDKLSSKNLSPEIAVNYCNWHVIFQEHGYPECRDKSS